MTPQLDHAKYIRRRNNDGFRLKYALNHTERKILIRELNPHCLVLFEYYLRLASTDNAVITDEDAADYFGWNLPVAQRHRLALTRAGWFARERVTLKGGRRIHMTYLGKDEVWESGLAPEGMTKPTGRVQPAPTPVHQPTPQAVFQLQGNNDG